MSRPLALGLLTLAGCSSGPAIVELPGAPPGAGVVVAIGRATGLAVEAFAAERAPASVEVPAAGDEVEVLHYRPGLEAHGLSAGTLAPALAGEASRPLPAGDAEYRLDLEAASFSPSTERSTRLAGFRIPALAAPCPTAVVRAADRYDLPTDRPFLAAARLDADRVLVATSGSAVYSLASGALTQLPRRNFSPLTALHAAPDGRLFGAVADGAVITLSLEGANLRETELARVRGMPIALDGGPRGARGYELFTLSSVGDVDHLVLDESPKRVGTIQGIARYVTLVRTAEGEALAFTTDGGHRADADGLTAEALPEAGEPFAAAQTPVGPILGFDTGRLFRRSGSGYEELASPQLGFWVIGVAPFRTGFVFLMASGAVGLYLPETGFCPMTAVFRAIQGGAVVVLGERVVAIGVLADLSAVGQTLEFQ